MKTYVLRSTNFSYDDGYSYDSVYSLWKIHSDYDNYETVTAAKKRLEIQAMRQLEPVQFLHLHGAKSYQPIYFELSDYCKTEFGVVLELHQIFYIPSKATDEQVLDIIQILNVEFYKIAEFDGEASFWKPEMNTEFWGGKFLSFDKGNLFEREYKGYSFFNSAGHASIEVPKILFYWLSTYSRNGSIAGLSGTLDTLFANPLTYINF